MSKSARRFLTLALTLGLAVAAAACSPSGPAAPLPQEPAPAPSGARLMPLRFGPVAEFPARAVPRPAPPLSYLVENNLEFTRETVGKTVELYVFGLRNLEVQKKINSNLSDLYEFIRTGGIPPYRGVRTLVPADSTLTTVEFEATASFNYNDVLSIVVHYYKEYQVEPSGSTPLVLGTETRNFDLATGEEIPLSYVFCDDVDYISLLDGVIRARHSGLRAADESYGVSWQGDWTPALVMPFRGVRADQVFYLNEGQLLLVLDHRTPEFDPGFATAHVPVSFHEFPGAIAVAHRFYGANANLYLKQDQRALVLPLVTASSSAMEMQVAQHLGEAYAYVSQYSMPVSVSAAVQSFVRTEFASYRDTVASFSGRGDGYWALNKGIATGQFGQYTMVFVTEVVSRLEKPPAFVEELRWMMHQGGQDYELRESIYCFSPQGEILQLNDLFRPGFDYDTVIRYAYAHAPGYEHVQRPDYREIARQTVFSLEAREIVFRTPYLPTGYGHKESIRFTVPYKDIGYENLTIFR